MFHIILLHKYNYILYIYAASYFTFHIIQYQFSKHGWKYYSFLNHMKGYYVTFIYHYNNPDKMFQSIFFIYLLLGWTLPMNDPFELFTAVLVTSHITTYIFCSTSSYSQSNAKPMLNNTTLQSPLTKIACLACTNTS